MSTVHEVLECRNELLHRKAIWKEMHSYLEQFISTDTGPAKMGIVSEGDGLTVPQDLIVETREAILEDLAEVDDQLEKLDQREVAENDEEDDGCGEEEEGETSGEEEASS